MLPADLGRLKGSVLRTGRFYLPVGSEGQRAYQIAVEEMPRLGAAYTQARAGLAGAEHRLEAARQGLHQLEQKLRPQLEESRQLEPRAERRDLAERVLSLRPRDQIALARAHGPRVVDCAVERAPEQAARATTAREWWMRNLTPSLDRALDRQLIRRGIPSPLPERSSAAWLENALDIGLRPSHAIQALARVGVPLADTLRATARILSSTRAVIGHPVKSAVRLTAQAMGVPTLPLRLASISWSLARDLVRTLSR